MDSPLGPTLANVFLCHWEEIWLKKCSEKFKPVYYKRYIDGTFLLFSTRDHIKKFFRFINSRQKYVISRHWLLEKKKSLPPTFTVNLLVVYIPIFMFFLPESYKTGLCLTLLFRTYTICLDWSQIHTEINKLRNILIKNNFHQNSLIGVYNYSFTNFSLLKRRRSLP